MLFGRADRCCWMARAHRSSPRHGCRPGGSVAVSAAQITVQGGAQIASSAFGQGPGGSVSVNATGDLTLTGNRPRSRQRPDRLAMPARSPCRRPICRWRAGRVSQQRQYRPMAAISSFRSRPDVPSAELRRDHRRWRERQWWQHHYRCPVRGSRRQPIRADAVGGNGGNIGIAAGNLSLPPTASWKPPRPRVSAATSRSGPLRYRYSRACGSGEPVSFARGRPDRLHQCGSADRDLQPDTRGRAAVADDGDGLRTRRYFTGPVVRAHSGHKKCRAATPSVFPSVSDATSVSGDPGRMPLTSVFRP